MSVSTGLEVLRWGGYRMLRGRRIGLFTNHSAVDRRLQSAHRLFAADLGDDLAALFSPEHGLSGAAPAGEAIGSSQARACSTCCCRNRCPPAKEKTTPSPSTSMVEACAAVML